MTELIKPYEVISEEENEWGTKVTFRAAYAEPKSDHLYRDVEVETAVFAEPGEDVDELILNFLRAGGWPL